MKEVGVPSQATDISPGLCARKGMELKMPKTEAIGKPGNLAEEYRQGNVRVRIFDDYLVKTDDEKTKADERIGRICQDIVTAARKAGKDI